MRRYRFSRGIAPMVLALALPAGARAEVGEWALTLGAGATGITSEPLVIAPTLSAGLRYGASDFWILGATLDAGPRFADGLDGGHALATAEAVYAIDIVTWVPRLSVGLGALVTLADESRIDLALTAGLGLEYRADRDWALLFTGRYLYLPTAEQSAFSFVFGYTLYFE
jgi:hypothetical protein